MQYVGYMVLTLWLDAILPDSSGAWQSPWAFLHWGFWRPSQVAHYHLQPMAYVYITSWGVTCALPAVHGAGRSNRCSHSAFCPNGAGGPQG